MTPLAKKLDDFTTTLFKKMKHSFFEGDVLVFQKEKTSLWRVV